MRLVSAMSAVVCLSISVTLLKLSSGLGSRDSSREPADVKWLCFFLLCDQVTRTERAGALKPDIAG